MNRIRMFMQKYSGIGNQFLAFFKKKSKYRTLVILLGLAILLGASILLVTRTSMAARSAAEFRALLSTPFPDDPAIQKLQAELQNKNLSKPVQASLMEKITIAAHMAAEQKEGQSQKQKEKVPPPLPPSSSFMNNALDVPEGIYEGSQGMIRPSMAQISTCWQGVRGGKVIQVFAGSLPDQSEQGVLIIFEEHPDQMSRTMNIVQAQAKTGMLRIISVKGDTVNLQTIDKKKLVFSLETMGFIQ